MSKKDEQTMSKKLEKAILFALDYNLRQFQKERELVPILYSYGQHTKDDVMVTTFNASPDIFTQAADYLNGMPHQPRYYVLVFDGKMHINDEVFNAVIVKAGERGKPKGHMAYQQYDTQTMEQIGVPEYGGETEQFLQL